MSGSGGVEPISQPLYYLLSQFKTLFHLLLFKVWLLGEEKKDKFI